MKENKEEEGKSMRTEKQEIRKRKRSFRLFCLAAVLLLQGGYASMTALARTHTKTYADAGEIADAKKGYSGHADVTYLQPGDEIEINGSQVGWLAGIGPFKVTFRDKAEGAAGADIYSYSFDAKPSVPAGATVDAYGNRIAGDMSTGSDDDWTYYIQIPGYDEVFAKPGVTATRAIAEGMFREWQITLIRESSSRINEIVIQAIPYTTQHNITYDVDAMKGSNPADNPATFWEGMSTVVQNAVANEGYRFDGWYEQSGGTEYDTLLTGNTISTDRTTDVNLQARFSARDYGITYQLNGGSNAAGNPSGYTYGTGVASFENPTREGYTFEGWYDGDAYATQITSISTANTGDVTLWAKWSEAANDEDDDDDEDESLPEETPAPPVKDAVPKTGEETAAALPAAACVTAAAALALLMQDRRRSRRH